jgi:hypothetical protein
MAAVQKFEVISDKFNEESVGCLQNSSHDAYAFYKNVIIIIIIQFFILMSCTNSQMANYRHSTNKIIIIIKEKCL